MPSCKVHDLGHLGLGDVARKEPADANAAGMDMQHDLGSFFPIQMEEGLQNLDDEFHGGKVVVEQEYLVTGRWLELRSGFLDRHPLLAIPIHIRSTHVNAKSHGNVTLDLTLVMGSLYLALKASARRAKQDAEYK
mgnify:CR=1 FL=1